MRKQLDARIPTLIRNTVGTHHRSFFVLVGDRGRDQVVNLHFLLSQARTTARPSVLWCYRKELGFTTHRKKREAKIKRDIKRGIRDKEDGLDPFELFVGVTDIRYCYYKDTHKVLGRTFGMLVLQDFEAITPNLLARTIETVEGGGIVVLLLKTMTSLRQLYSAAMDVHAKYRSSMDPSDPVARFNERFLLSLSASPSCLILDDELNVLPISKGKDVLPIEDAKGKGKLSAEEEELKDIKEDLKGNEVVGPLVGHCKTVDQAKGVLTILDVLSSSSLSTTVALTAARGRGKSAALGLSIAAAIAHGYANIFVTSPSPENLRTLFEFLFKGLQALGYEEVADWDLQRGVGEWKDLVVRVNVFRGHRQTVQYITPNDAHVLGQAELVVIDEAAAIPLPLVRNLMGPYLVFLSSTINGYEGTGRSLSLKLIQQLRDASKGLGAKATAEALGDDDATMLKTASASGPRTDTKAISNGGRSAALTTRNLKEVKLDEPIRYSSGDDVESWLHELLCLDASLTQLTAKGASPHPSKCDLYLVNRDALFSYHAASEAFLQKMMALYVASHYKNSPNDLQLMSDAPGHRLFVLLAPLSESKGGLPEPLCVVQVALEGNISKQSILNSLARGHRSAGDLIPWIIAQQYQDAEFASLSGARIVRIAVHPDHAKSGYGSRALECLRRFYAGDLLDADAVAAREAKGVDLDGGDTFAAARDAATSADGLASDNVGVRDAARMPALLQRLSDRRPENLDWIGVSYGLTPALFRFWRRAGYSPIYLRQQANELTGEYSALQIRGIEEPTPDSPAPGWIASFASDFRRRFMGLLGYKFRELQSVQALSILDAISAAAKGGDDGGEPLGLPELRMLLSPFDMKRLQAFVNSTLELHVVVDLMPALATLYFTNRLRAPPGGAEEVVDPSRTEEDEDEELKLSGLQSAMLLAVGLQRKDIADLESELGLPFAQALALFSKAIRRIVQSLRRVEKREAARALPEAGVDGPLRKGAGSWRALDVGLEDELRRAGEEDEAARKRAAEEREANPTPAAVALGDKALERFAIQDRSNEEWEEAERRVRELATKDGQEGLSTVFSVKGSEREEKGKGGATASDKKRKEEQKDGKKGKKLRRS